MKNQIQNFGILLCVSSSYIYKSVDGIAIDSHICLMCLYFWYKARKKYRYKAKIECKKSYMTRRQSYNRTNVHNIWFANTRIQYDETL